MGRIRTIKPDFFIDEDIARLEPITRLLFIGLWTLADREGRLEDRPERIRLQLLGYDQIDINSLLNELSSCGFIVRYKHNDRAYIAIRTFLKHQCPHVKERSSTIPAPEST